MTNVESSMKNVIKNVVFVLFFLAEIITLSKFVVSNL